jgi:hypothetical protein
MACWWMAYSIAVPEMILLMEMRKPISVMKSQVSTYDARTITY